MTTTLPASALRAATPSDEQILEVFAEYGRPNDEQCTMTYNAPQIVAAVRALLSKQHATASFHQDLSHPLKLAPPAQDLATSLVAAGSKAAHVSASETHEIADFMNGGAYARLLQSVQAKSKGAAQFADIRAELNQLGMMAHTAMNQDPRDMRNIMEDLAGRLLALACDAPAASPLAAGGTVAWFDPKGDITLWKELEDAQGEDNLATVAPLLRKLCAPLSDSGALRDLLAERARQIQVEGFSLERDDSYINGELAQAAACYAASSQSRDISYMSHLWPWAKEWWKPGTTREDLLKAGALVLAEIERIDRARVDYAGRQRKEG
ncbi:Uncharacterised protein [Achromobacter sp. 2789STDY5608633]|uniref:hypothetical protein n=1 Tax=Achromobacter sp. 2789STDY5608633 TaxID=1806501 RepID=UPI0006C07A78|nr:hypothetical protein [Achromobacter sp. 2789STDY5608633]CUJ50224.1 Uncharacterised protein [Achromobacter sp. 2789STDY5608633]